jgi:hypothetical protein
MFIIMSAEDILQSIRSIKTHETERPPASSESAPKEKRRYRRRKATTPYPTKRKIKFEPEDSDSDSDSDVPDTSRGILKEFKQEKKKVQKSKKPKKPKKPIDISKINVSEDDLMEDAPIDQMNDVFGD